MKIHFFLVGMLPIVMIRGPKMTPTTQGNNVILTYETSIYTLKIKESKYEWLKIPNQLSISRQLHVQLLVPASTIQCQGILPPFKAPTFISKLTL